MLTIALLVPAAIWLTVVSVVLGLCVSADRGDRALTRARRIPRARARTAAQRVRARPVT
jgi:hypothetical protein